jgi:hypothetical protein
MSSRLPPTHRKTGYGTTVDMGVAEANPEGATGMVVTETVEGERAMVAAWVKRGGDQASQPRRDRKKQ